MPEAARMGVMVPVTMTIVGVVAAMMVACVMAPMVTAVVAAVMPSMVSTVVSAVPVMAMLRRRAGRKGEGRQSGEAEDPELDRFGHRNTPRLNEILRRVAITFYARRSALGASRPT